jgi:hypothetical protein
MRPEPRQRQNLDHEHIAHVLRRFFEGPEKIKNQGKNRSIGVLQGHQKIRELRTKMGIAETLEIIPPDLKIIQEITLTHKVDLGMALPIKDDVVKRQQRQTGTELARIAADPLKDSFDFAVIARKKNRNLAGLAEIESP